MRKRWLFATVAALVLLLFGGQWLADLLAERWWAGNLVPEAAGFVSGVRLLRLTLDVAAILLGTAWYTGHLLVVHRAIGSVQIARQVANLEIREAVTPASLLPLALGVGVALGLVAGLGSGDAWPTFALAWQGVTYGVTDPFLHKDLGVFVAQLPLWTTLRDFVRFLVWSALLVIVALYAALGAIRWQGGRPAISNHARRHIGILLAGGSLVLGWSFLLAPFEAAAQGAVSVDAWSTLELASLALGGACLAAAAVSLLWAARGQHLLMIAGWTVLLGCALLVRLMAGNAGEAGEAEQAANRRVAFDQLAFGLNRLDDRAPRTGTTGDPGLPSLWTRVSIGQLIAADSQTLEAAAPATIPTGTGTTPVWLAVRASPAGQVSVVAIDAGRTGANAAPLSFREGDSLAYPGVVSFATLATSAVRPGAPRLVVDSGATGLRAGSLARRLVLGWSLQSTRVLSAADPRARVRWHLAPRERLTRLAPFAAWDDPRMVLVGGRFTWLAYGYLSSTTFPASTRVSEQSMEIAALEAGIVGTVDASTGASAIYLLPDAGPMARSWATVTQGVVRPTSELPTALVSQLPYPRRLFDAQAIVLEQPAWRAGSLPGRAPDGLGDPVAPTVAWDGGSRMVLVTGYQREGDHRIHALLTGRVTEMGRRLVLGRLSEAGTLPGPAASQATWDRFPSYEQMRDSVVRGGGRFERGPWRILPMGGAPIAYQPWYAYHPNAEVSQPYLSLAQGKRAGAGRSFAEAWNNLRGTGAPLPPGFGPRTPLEEARRWMMRADSALRAGDWEAFGRAFGALRQALGAGQAE